MKNLIYILSISLFFSCQKEEKITILDCEDNPRHGVCLNEEMIIDDSTQVPMFQSGNTERGFISGIKSNQPWVASAFNFQIDSIFNTDNFTSGFETFSSAGFLRESISIRGIPRKVGCYPLERQSGFFRNEIPSISYTLLGDDGNVLVGSYVLNPMHRDSNLIEITEIDTFNRKVYGRLGASFVLSALDGLDLIHPDFIRLFNCEIEATYE